MVKSKWGLAFSAIVTVIASLLMSCSICLFFGLSPSLNGRFIYIYIENIIYIFYLKHFFSNIQYYINYIYIINAILLINA